MTVTDRIAHALEDEIRSRVYARSEYRRHRFLYPDSAMERENDRMLGYLFSIRRDGIRDHQEEQRRLDAAMKAHREAVEAEEWRRTLAEGRYVDLPDVPLALSPDAGDHYLRPTGTAA